MNTTEATRELLVSRTRRGVFREVSREGDVLVKRYCIPAGLRRYPRPWEHEHAALLRLLPLGFPLSHGFKVDRSATGAEVTYSRAFLPGSAITAYGEAEAREMGALLARIHGAGVITNDAQGYNFIRDAQGCMQFIDFGVARTFDRRTPAFYLRVGHELYDAMRMPFSGNRALGRLLCASYARAAKLSAPVLALVRLGIACAAVSRWLRKALHLSALRAALRKRSAPQAAPVEKEAPHAGA